MSFIIRPTTRQDCALIEGLIRELAEYEKMPNGPKIDAQVLIKDGGFDGGQKFYHSFVATIDDQVIGFVLFFYIYSTWEGKAIWMEDLYVQPQYRGKGYGTKLWQAVAKQAQLDDCCRIDFYVLDWNEPSIMFYKSHGALNMSEEQGWNVFRLNREAIGKLANRT